LKPVSLHMYRLVPLPPCFYEHFATKSAETSAKNIS